MGLGIGVTQGSTCEQLPSMLNVYSFTTDESLSSPTTPLFVTHDTSLPNPHAGTLQLAQCCAGRRGSTCHMMFSWCIYMIQTIYFWSFFGRYVELWVWVCVWRMTHVDISQIYTHRSLYILYINTHVYIVCFVHVKTVYPDMIELHGMHCFWWTWLVWHSWHF